MDTEIPEDPEILVDQDTNQAQGSYQILHDHGEDHILLYKYQHKRIKFFCTQLKKDHSQEGIQKAQDQYRDDQEQIVEFISIDIIIFPLFNTTGSFTSSTHCIKTEGFGRRESTVR
jgi:hypothetical protein